MTAAALVASPLALWVAGRELGEQLGHALGSTAVAEALGTGLTASAAAGGAAAALAAPRLGHLGDELLAAPLRRRAALLAIVALPGGAFALVASVSATCLLVPLAAASPGRVPAGIGLLSAVLGSAALGAALLEAGRLAVHRRLAGLVGLVTVFPVWALLVAGDSLAVGFPETAEALAGRASPFRPLAVGGLAFALGAAGWLALAPVEVHRRRRVGLVTPVPIPSRPAAAALVASTLLTVRRADVRLAACTGVALGAAGAVLASALDLEGVGSATLAGAAAAFVTCIAPLRAAGAAAEGRVTWSPLPAGTVALTWAAPSGALPVGAACVVALAAAPSGGASVHEVGVVAVVAATCSAAALAAGSIVPWRDSGVGDQLVAFALFSALAGLLSLTTGVVTPRLVAAGAPGPVAVALLAAFGLAAAVALVGVHVVRRRQC